MSSASGNILELKNVKVVYDNVILALHDVTLNVPKGKIVALLGGNGCLLYTSPSPRDATLSRMPSSA